MKGIFYIDEYLTFYINIHKNNAVGAPDAAPTYRVYEEETASPGMTGAMATLDSSNATGFYSEQIQLTANNGFEYGKCYCIRVSATVDSLVQADVQRFAIKTEAEHKIKRAADLILVGTVSDADFSPTTTAFEVTGLTDSTTDAYKGCFVKVETGNNKYEVKQITASSVVTTNVRLTVETMQAALASGVTVLVF